MGIPKLKFLEHKKTFKKGGLSTSPDLFWKFALLSGLILVVLSCVLGFFLFRSVSRGTVFDGSGRALESQAISKERLDKALEYFSVKQQKSEEILNSPSPVVDPSL